MKQEEIVNEIRQMCGQTILMPSLGWHFKYNGQVYFYVVGKDESMVRFCIPFVARLPLYDKELLKEAVNETNRNVKFIKALLSEKDDAKVSLDYDHKITDQESAKDIVPHIIKSLDFAVGFLERIVRQINNNN
ncbi:YbjN domain-containing protein [Hallella faecis]|uniref:YbjN domain-containing protein n=1 Tax=Hallella faecis TaxID=2841596 RepID=A0ABV1FRD1_9BACT|nr:YbjN domain-containing protein [Hallella faecis]MBU0290161.1 YbjN domain-containing protein [Hallella faecis]